MRWMVQLVGAVSLLIVSSAVPAPAQEKGWQGSIRAGDEALAARDYDGATRLFQAAWRHAEGFDLSDPRRAETLARLARVYRAQGDFAKPEELYQQALQSAEKAYGPAATEYADHLNEVGRYFHTRRKYARAEEYYKKAFAIRVRALGKEHAAVAESINNLAILYENESRHDKAEVYYQHALAIREKTLGPDHLDTIATLEHFARLLHKMNRAAQAAPLRERAQAARARRVEEMANGEQSSNSAEIFDASDGVRPPRLSSRTEPEYSEEARIARHEGTVVLRADVSPQGEARNFQLIRSLGLGLDEKAVEAVRSWKFEPARKGNQRVPFRAVLEIHFRVL